MAASASVDSLPGSSIRRRPRRLDWKSPRATSVMRPNGVAPPAPMSQRRRRPTFPRQISTYWPWPQASHQHQNLRPGQRQPFLLHRQLLRRHCLHLQHQRRQNRRHNHQQPQRRPRRRRQRHHLLQQRHREIFIRVDAQKVRRTQISALPFWRRRRPRTG